MRLLAVLATFAVAWISASAAQAQDNRLPALTQRAVAACEAASSGRPLTGNPGLNGFVPIQIRGALEAVGRGIMTGADEVWVKVMRNSDACVVMVKDTIRREAGAAVEAWIRGTGITFTAQQDGFRTGRRAPFNYRQHRDRDGIHVILVARQP